jgi:hypothetical protein
MQEEQADDQFLDVQRADYGRRFDPCLLNLSPPLLDLLISTINE